MALEIQIHAGRLLDLDTDLLVVGVPRAGGKDPQWPPFWKALDGALGGGLTKVVTKEDFTGKRDQSLSLGSLGQLKADKVVVIGLGDRRSFGPPEIRTFAAKAARFAGAEKARSLALVIPPGVENELRAVAE